MNRATIFVMMPTVMMGIISLAAMQQAVYAEKGEDDDELSRYDIDVLCDASEDYEANKEQCDKLYDMVEDDEDDDGKSITSTYLIFEIFM